jgi:hypothetical protein
MRNPVAELRHQMSRRLLAQRRNEPLSQSASKTVAAAVPRWPVRPAQPKCLQRKSERQPAGALKSHIRVAAIARPTGEVNRSTGRLPGVAGRASLINQPGPSAPRSPNRNFSVQRFVSRVVQAVKFYPNLHPGAVEPVDTSNIFKLNSFANQYRLHKVNSHGVNVPNQQYNFVRTREGEMLLHSRYRHPSIAGGKQVLYAGEIFFNNGQLEWWSNGSGHYQPYVDDAEQAALPMDHFFSYQQVIKGEHKRQKS